MKRAAILLITLLVAACTRNEFVFNGKKLDAIIADCSKEAWALKDSIGVFGTEGSNYAFVLDQNYAGKPNGRFNGLMAGQPLAAYYPYSDKVNASKSHTAVVCELPSEQSTNGRFYNFMAAGTPQGSKEEGFTFEFNSIFAQLNISIIPDESIAQDSLMSLILSAPGRQLAGTFTVNLLNALKTSGTTQSELKLTYDEKPSLTNTITAKLVFNPSLKKTDPLEITIVTTSNTATIKIEAGITAEAGQTYDLVLDIAQLRASGKACVSGADIMSYLTYHEGQDQFSTCEQGGMWYYSVININKGYAVKMCVPSELKVGDTYNIEVSGVGTKFEDATYTTKFVRADGNWHYFEDAANRLEFAIYR